MLKKLGMKTKKKVDNGASTTSTPSAAPSKRASAPARSLNTNQEVRRASAPATKPKPKANKQDEKKTGNNYDNNEEDDIGPLPSAISTGRPSVTKRISGLTMDGPSAHQERKASRPSLQPKRISSMSDNSNGNSDTTNTSTPKRESRVQFDPDSTPPPSIQKTASRESRSSNNSSQNNLDMSLSSRSISFESPDGSTAPSLMDRNSTNYVATDVEAALKNAPPHKWKKMTCTMDGQVDYLTCGKVKDVSGKSIQKAIQKFEAEPWKYAGLMFQTSMKTWQRRQQKYTLIYQKDTDQLKPRNIDDKGIMTFMSQHYQHLPSLPDNVIPEDERDPYTWNMTIRYGRLLHIGDNKPLLPGRGMGVADTPSIKIIGDIDPSDISQGMVGDCWLLSAISAIAEFDGAIKRLFRKTVDIDLMPYEDGRVNHYIISLYDLETWKEVDIVIDESLAASPAYDGRLLGARPSEDGELWVPYLEKAMAILCGGWDEITGGQSSHAWAMMTGCKQQYTIVRNQKTNKFFCMAKWDPYKKQWAPHYNSPHKPDIDGGEMYRCPWPAVGGGGSEDLEIDEDELFLKMVAWDEENYIVAAGIRNLKEKDGETDGLVDNHAYSVIDAHPNVAGTNICLFKVRNPWGEGEIEEGYFDDDGPGWDDYPQVKTEINPVAADDGIFYLTKEEFFKFYDHIYVSASNMTAYKED